MLDAEFESTPAVEAGADVSGADVSGAALAPEIELVVDATALLLYAMPDDGAADTPGIPPVVPVWAPMPLMTVPDPPTFA